MTFYEKVQDLCRKKGFEISNLDKALNIKICKSTVSKWKNGAVPRAATVKAIADYFGVTVDYLTGEEQSLSGAASSEASSDVVIFHRNGKTETHRFTEAEMQILYNLMKYMKSSQDESSVDTND